MKTTLLLIALAVAATAECGRAAAPESATELRARASEPLFDDFKGGKLNPSRWLIARTQWGGKRVNGGVVPENIRLESGKLIITGHGDEYVGPVRGVRRNAAGRVVQIPHGRRTGACLVTRDLYASGRYEVRMKVPQNVGVCTALWTFHYREVGREHEEYVTNDGQGDVYISNHEIDIELPGRPRSQVVDISYDWALFNTWVGERDQDMTFGPTKLPFKVNDGKFHTWRFDWHTGDPDGRSGKVIEPRVDFYLDGKRIRTIRTTVPVDAGRFWMGLWFPNEWAGTPDFDVETLEIDWVRITPFHEPGDRYEYSEARPGRTLLGVKNWPDRLRPSGSRKMTQHQGEKDEESGSSKRRMP